MKKKDNLDRDVAAAMRLGYGVHYGRYKADHPHTDMEVSAPKPEKELDYEPEHIFNVPCALCGREFIRTHNGMKYCSDECRQEAARLRYKQTYQPRVRVCPICGTSITGCGQRYCSIECRAEAKRRRKEGSDIHWNGSMRP